MPTRLADISNNPAPDLWEILHTVEDFLDRCGGDENEHLCLALNLPLVVLSPSFKRETPEGHVAELIEDLGNLASYLSGLDLSAATKQRLEAIAAAALSPALVPEVRSW